MSGPTLITGARIIDPATGRDGPGALLVVDGRIAGTQQWRAAGRPRRRGRHRRQGPRPRPRPHRHARLHRRAGPRVSRNPGLCRRRSRGRRGHQLRLDAGHQSGDRRWCACRFPAPARQGDGLGQYPSRRRHHPRPQGRRDHRVRSPQGSRRRGADGWAAVDPVGRPPSRRLHLRPQFRSAGHPPRR